MCADPCLMSSMLTASYISMKTMWLYFFGMPVWMYFTLKKKKKNGTVCKWITWCVCCGKLITCVCRGQCIITPVTASFEQVNLDWAVTRRDGSSIYLWILFVSKSHDVTVFSCGCLNLFFFSFFTMLLTVNHWLVPWLSSHFWRVTRAVTQFSLSTCDTCRDSVLTFDVW